MSSFKKGGFGGGGFGGGRKGDEVPYKNPHEDPFADLGEASGDIEEDTAEEVEAISSAMAGFKQRAKNESKRFELAVDAAYWSGICFRSQADCDKFFEAIGFSEFYRGQHVDGYKLAKCLGLEVDWENDTPLKKPKGT